MAQHAEVDLPGFYNSEKAREALGGGKMSGATAVFRIKNEYASAPNAVGDLRPYSEFPLLRMGHPRLPQFRISARLLVCSRYWLQLFAFARLCRI